MRHGEAVIPPCPSRWLRHGLAVRRQSSQLPCGALRTLAGSIKARLVCLCASASMRLPLPRQGCATMFGTLSIAQAGAHQGQGLLAMPSVSALAHCATAWPSHRFKPASSPSLRQADQPKPSP